MAGDRTTRKVVMNFYTTASTNYDMIVDNAKEDLTDAQVKTAMNGIIAAHIFAPKGAQLAGIRDARIEVLAIDDLDVEL